LRLGKRLGSKHYADSVLDYEDQLSIAAFRTTVAADSGYDTTVHSWAWVQFS